MADSVVTMIRDLMRRKGRERRGLAVAEGVRLVEEALDAGVPFRGAAIGPALESTVRGQALKARLVSSGMALSSLSDRELADLADTEHPQGVIAVITPRAWTLEQLETGTGVFLVLDGVQDPGNVGTIIRSAHALGAAGVIALKGTADLTNPKVLRGSMGSSFRLPWLHCDDEAFLAWAVERKVSLHVAAMDGVPVGRWRPARPAALVLGNEGAGVRAELADRAAGRVGIPLHGQAESLNVAVAAGILLFEVLDAR